MQRWIQTVMERPVTVTMLTLAGIVFGAVSLSKLPVELLPEITYPSLTIQTELPDAAPEEVEQLVTRPIEQVVGVVSGLKRYTSVSRAGVAEITLEFGWNIDMDLASLDVREKLDLVEFPPDALSPIVYRFDPSLHPILRIALIGDFETRDLRKLAEEVLKKKLETVEGVAAAKVVGGAEEEIHVELNEGRLNALGLTIDEVARRIGEENVNRSGGELRDSDAAYLLRTVKLFQSLEDIEATIIRESPEGGRVRLRDIGRVYFGTEQREVRVRVEGRPAVEVHLYKEGDANAVKVANGVRTRLGTIAEDRRLAGTELEVLFDQARYIEDSVDNVEKTALWGALLASGVLFLFLRDLFSTFVIALSIPISITVTFLLMHLSGVSLNVMSLGGLALGIGMLVDNSVVVLEAVARHREAGRSAREATLEGTREVVGGIVASTLTTIAVFLPLIFVEGIAGQLFHDQALTVTYALLASLFVAITVIPAVLGHRSGRGLLRTGFGLVARALERLLSPLTGLVQVTVKGSTNLYGRILAGFSRVPWVSPLVAAVLFVAVVPWAQNLGLELVPDLSQGEFYFDVELPDGTPLDTTDRKVIDMERAVERVREATPAPFASCYVTVGGTPVLGDVRAGDRQDHIARVNISLRPETRRETEERVISDLTEAFSVIPGMNTRLGRPTLFSFRAPIEVEVFSDDLLALWEGARITTDRLRKILGLVDVQSSVAERTKEVHVRLDPVKLAASGLSQGEVARVLANKGLGEVPTQYNFGVKPLDIRVRVAGARYGTIGDMARLSVSRSAEGIPMPLAALGELRRGLGPVEVRHIAGERAALVTARLEGTDLGSASRDVRRALQSRENPLPKGVTAQLSGQNEEMRGSLDSLALALGLAIFLVYMVLSSSFESLRLPFAVILTVPLGLIGAVLALYLTGLSVSVFAMIGVILLSGIVVNNGIIFISRIQQHRAAGLSASDAARSAGLERLRPIVITTATTILGLLPLALGLGAGAELRQPLAITVIGGLLVGTVLTLQVVPSSYLLLEGRASAREKERA